MKPTDNRAVQPSIKLPVWTSLQRFDNIWYRILINFYQLSHFYISEQPCFINVFKGYRESIYLSIYSWYDHICLTIIRQ